MKIYSILCKEWSQFFFFNIFLWCVQRPGNVHFRTMSLFVLNSGLCSSSFSGLTHTNITLPCDTLLWNGIDKSIIIIIFQIGWSENNLKITSKNLSDSTIFVVVLHKPQFHFKSFCRNKKLEFIFHRKRSYIPYVSAFCSTCLTNMNAHNRALLPFISFFPLYRQKILPMNNQLKSDQHLHWSINRRM